MFFECGIANVGVGLIVTKKDVELRLVLLDQIIFKGERLFYVVDDNVIDVGNFTHQRAGLGVLYGLIEKIGTDTIPQRLSFSDVKHFLGSVLKKIHAGL